MSELILHLSFIYNKIQNNCGYKCRDNTFRVIGVIAPRYCQYRQIILRIGKIVNLITNAKIKIEELTLLLQVSRYLITEYLVYYCNRLIQKNSIINHNFKI